MADFKQKMTLLAERGTPVGEEEMIERVARELAGQPHVVVRGQRKGMTVTKTEERTATTPQRTRRRGYTWAVAAFLAVLVAGAGLYAMSLGSDDDGPVATPTDVEVAASFIEARNSWDAEATEDLLTPNAAIDDLEVPRAADYLEQYRWYEAIDWRWALDECTETVSGSPSTVSCSYNMDNAWSRALDVGPIAGSMEFVIVDGRIFGVSHKGFNLGQFGPVWNSFRSWVQENHSDDFNAIYSGGSNTPVYTPDAAELWGKLTDEFVADTAGS